MSEPAPAPNRYAVLRVRDFRLYLVARFDVSFAQQMLGVAVGWELFDRTRSPLALGLVGLTQIVPLLLPTLPAGHLADQLDRRGILQWATGFTALCCAGPRFFGLGTGAPMVDTGGLPPCKPIPARTWASRS